MHMYAEVVVNKAIIQRQTITKNSTNYQEWYEQAETRLKTFYYRVPSQLSTIIKLGHLVEVPFRWQHLQGIVIALHKEITIDDEKIRPLEAILMPEPIVTPPQIALAQWLANEYLAPLSTCLNYFLPPGTNRKPITVVKPITPSPPLPEDLTPLERALQLYLQQQKKPVPIEDLEAKVVTALVEKGLAEKESILSKPKIAAKFELTVECLISVEEFDEVLATLGFPSKQANILSYLAELDDPIPTAEDVLEAVGCTNSPLKALVEKELVDYFPTQTFVSVVPQQTNKDSPPTLSSDAKQVLAQLAKESKPIAIENLNLDADKQEKALKLLTDVGLISTFDEAARVSLHIARADIPNVLLKLRKTTRHAAVLNLLAQEDGPVWVGWVYAQTEATKKTLSDLVEAKAIAFNEVRHWRDPLADKTFTLDKPPLLTPEQTSIMEKLIPTLNIPLTDSNKPFLIHGVTGSGKTEIYLQAIKEVLKAHKGIIFLVPEIILATQIVTRVQARFPKQVAVWHSALSPGERFDTWERVRQGVLPIVVGPRSALFAPIQKLGLIIVDEEHEPAYKAYGSGPTFHTRDAAIELARLNNIPIIMGSATPDVVSYRKGQRGEYHLLSLPNRILAHKKHLAVQQALLKRIKAATKNKTASQTTPSPSSQSSSAFVSLPMPPVEIVDLREELKAGNRSIFSGALEKGIEDTLKAGEQVILFLNRRGTATFVICRDCGYVMECPECDTTITYHASNVKMVCHYCGYQTTSPKICPECSRQRIRYFGLGTERVEATLRRMFPEARPIRLDQDTTRKAGSHYALLQHFVEGRANVMIGTQMVAKGLDLPMVTLVGVISADTALYLPEFRAAERTFQVLMQVAGRAGRSPLGGRVILQTYTPEQPAIMAAAEHDYLTFYNDELRFRYEQGYPPFKRLARLMYTGSGQEKSRLAAQDMVNRLQLWIDQQGFPSVEIIGPTPAYVHRLRSKYRWQILVRAPDPAKILRPVPLPINWRIDIDPVSLL